MKPEECPECESLALRHGKCSHCGFEEPPTSWKQIGLRGVDAARRQLKAAQEEPEENEQ